VYRYQPPKSSIWGHGLGAAMPLQQRERFEAFLSEAAAEYAFVGSWVTFAQRPDAEPDLVSRCTDALGSPWANAMTLTDEAFERHFKVLATDQALIDGLFTFSLLRKAKVTRWRIGERSVNTDSDFHISFGRRGTLSTFLEFNTTEEFDAVASALSQARLCRLNPKHLKLKRQRRPPSR
jgi:hypothetical protein